MRKMKLRVKNYDFWANVNRLTFWKILKNWTTSIGWFPESINCSQSKCEKLKRQNIIGIDVNQMRLVDFWKITDLNHILLPGCFFHNFSSVSPNKVQFEVLENLRAKLPHSSALSDKLICLSDVWMYVPCGNICCEMQV